MELSSVYEWTRQDGTRRDDNVDWFLFCSALHLRIARATYASSRQLVAIPQLTAPPHSETYGTLSFS
jgi:hypothetical protein